MYRIDICLGSYALRTASVNQNIYRVSTILIRLYGGVMFTSGDVLELIGIVFKNWDLYNSRKDVTKSSWFRFEHSFFDSSQFYGWSPLDRTIFVYLLCEASKQTKPGQNLVRVNPSHATACTSGILKDLHRVIKKL